MGDNPRTETTGRLSVEAEDYDDMLREAKNAESHYDDATEPEQPPSTPPKPPTVVCDAHALRTALTPESTRIEVFLPSDAWYL